MLNLVRERDKRKLAVKSITGGFLYSKNNFLRVREGWDGSSLR